MNKPTHSKEAIRAAMDHLIDRATNFDVDALETIYHKDFHTTLVMPDNAVATYDKETFHSSLPQTGARRQDAAQFVGRVA